MRRGIVGRVGPSISSMLGTGALRPVKVSPKTISFDETRLDMRMAQAARMIVDLVPDLLAR
jgi:hypothetical protein